MNDSTRASQFAPNMIATPAARDACEAITIAGR